MSSHETNRGRDQFINVNFRPQDPHRLQQSHRIEAEHTPPQGTEVWDTITSFPGRVSGYDDPRLFLRSFKREIIKYPQRKHIFVILGEPGGGKSTTLEQGMAAAMAEPEPDEELLDLSKIDYEDAEPNLARFFRENGLMPQYHYLPWGDASEFLHPRWYANKNVDYHDFPQIMAKKREEIKDVEYIFRTVFGMVLREPSVPGEVNIILSDIPVVSGLREGNSEIGIPRSNDLAFDLVHHRAEFADLDYEIHIAGLSASHAVRQKGFAEREALTVEGLSEEELRRRMLAQGMVVHGVTPGAIEQMAKEVANPRQLMYIERDVNQVAAHLLDGYTGYDRPPVYVPQVDPEIFDDNYPLRELTLGRIVIPHYLEKVLAVPENRRLNAWNGIPLDTVDVYTEYTLNRPIADSRDQIIARMRAERAAKKKRWPIDLYEAPHHLESSA